MPGLSIHVVDVTRGVPACGMRIEVYALEPQRRQIADGLLETSGALSGAISSATLAAGPYEVVFHAGDFFTSESVSQSNPPFLDVVLFRFNVFASEQHIHLPMKITPWGFSLYRGS